MTATAFSPPPPSSPPSSSPSAAGHDRVRELQARVHSMQGSAVTRVLPSRPGLAEVLRLRAGGAYAVDSPTVALALLAGPSAAGEWCAVVGAPDLGVEAAAELGVDLARTVWVPRPGEHWLSVTAGLLDLAGVVLVRPPAAVTEHQAARLRARLRQKGAALVSWGSWPRCEGTATVTGSSWTGLGEGHGHLAGRRLEVSVRQAGATRHRSLWVPAGGGDIEVVESATSLTALRVVG